MKRTRFFKIENFGAIGDGVSDDTVAFRNAFAQMATTIAVGEAAVLVVDAKTYLIRDLHIPAGMKLCGPDDGDEKPETEETP